MALSSNKMVIRTLYRGLLRAAARLDTHTHTQAHAHVDHAFVRAAAGAVSVPECATSYTSVVRDVFRRADAHPSVSARVDAGLLALAQANARAHAHETEQALAHTQTHTHEPTHTIGQVFRHKKYGYRAVIIGVDETCKASDKWIQATGATHLPSGLEQPFYRVLVDVRDRPEAQVSYVAQDNIEEVVTDDGASLQDRVVLHPLITRYFVQFSVEHGSFVPAWNMAMDDDGPTAANKTAEY